MQEVDARIVWSSYHYDGPAAGVAYFEGKHYWFAIRDTVDDRPRLFNLYPLSQSEFKLERQVHELFRIYIGTHCDYDENGRRLTVYTYHAPSSEVVTWCYNERDKLRSYAQRKAYEEREPIGWFRRS